MSYCQSKNKCASPKWILDDQWAVGTDPYNWILYRKFGKRWQAAGYYPSAHLLLERLFQKLTRMEGADPDLVMHVKRCFERVQGMADRLSEQLGSDDWKRSTRPSAHPEN